MTCKMGLVDFSFHAGIYSDNNVKGLAVCCCFFYGTVLFEKNNFFSLNYYFFNS
jgi:hypothetical protein